MTEQDFMLALQRVAKSCDALRESVDKLREQLSRIEGAAAEGPRVVVEDANAPEDPIDIVGDASGRVFSALAKSWLKKKSKKGG